MTLDQSNALRANAAVAERLAEALLDHPEVEVPTDTAGLLLDLADHHLGIAREVVRLPEGTPEANIVDGFLAADQANFEWVESELEQAAQEEAARARHHRREERLAWVATGVMVVVVVPVAWLLATLATNLW